MPWMYRIGCFRDDIIFFIYLYQRWIYRVDPKRVNEFGISGEDIERHQEQLAAGSSSSSNLALTEQADGQEEKSSRKNRKDKKRD